MAHDQHHEHLLKELTEMLQPVFTQSPQAIYLYLDDEHKSCNKNFAEMLGYGSVEEWVRNENTISDVTEENQEQVIQAYVNASEKSIAATLDAVWVRKDKSKLNTTLTMVPISYHGEVFVLHFITEKK